MKKIVAAALIIHISISFPVAAGQEKSLILQNGQLRQIQEADTFDANPMANIPFSTGVAGTLSAANAQIGTDSATVALLNDGNRSNSPQTIPKGFLGVNYNVPNIVTGSTLAASANAAAINSAMATVNAAGGGTVQLPCGAIYVSSPIDNVYSRVLVRGCGRDNYHDGGDTVSYGTTILPTNAINVLIHETQSGVGNSKNSGGGFQWITVNGNNLGLDLLRVISVNSGTYDLTLLNSVGTEAAYFGTRTTGVDLAEAADIQYAHVNLTIRQLDSVAARAANGVVLDGSGNANFSANNDVVIQVQHANGNALVCKNADNNNISIRAYRAYSGTGHTIYGYGGGMATGCYSNIFTNVSGGGPIYMRGTSDGDTRGVVNKIDWLDTANSSPIPMAGTGSSWQWTESATNSQANIRGYHMLIGNSAANVINGATSQASTTSLDVINDSSDALRIRTSLNSVSWGVAINNHNLRATQISGSNGAFETARVKLTEQAVKTLPACSSTYAGTVAAVSDANNPIYNATVTGGGADHILAYCNGTNWTAH